MIHDAKVEVTCDARCCDGSEYIYLPWVYSDNSVRSRIEDALNDLEWVIKGQYHFCCEDCFKDSQEEQDID